MAIPDYQTIMYPLLQSFSDRRVHRIRDIEYKLAKEFNLSDEEIKELLPSGRQQVFKNRVNWANTYLKKAGLLNSKKKGTAFITSRGLEVLNNKEVSSINTKFLRQFPEFVHFTRGNKQNIEENKKTTEEKTPIEIIEENHEIIKMDLANEILSTIKNCSPDFFEQLVVELLVKMGYGGSLKDAGQAVGKSGDGGIDGIIKEDQLGLDLIYIQAKRWEGNVGRPEIQKFAGALQGKRAKKGVFLTTSDFSEEAKEYVRFIDNKIILLSGEELAKLMIQFNLGVSIQSTVEIKRIDSDYFAE